MKNVIIYILILVPTICFGQFQIMNTPTSKNLEDVHFLDANIGIAVGDSGTIIRSTDGGLNWLLVMSIDSCQFHSVDFFDALNGIASGSDIYTTDDAGLTWTLRYKGYSNYNYASDLEILNDSISLVSNSQIGLMRSTNLGHTWDTLFSSPSGFPFRAMSFINDSVGFASSDIGPPNIGIFKTTDGGLSWDTIMSNSPWNITVLEDMIFLNDSLGFQAGWYNAHFVKTTNGGGSWTAPVTDSTITTQLKDMDIRADRPNSYYACGWYGEILKSADGGDSWYRIDDSIAPNIFNSIYFINDTLGWVVGSEGIILRTTNGGGAVAVRDFQKLDFLIYPNPTNGALNIELPKSDLQKASVELIDMTGKIIFRQQVTFQNVELNIEELSPSIYFIKVTQGKMAGIQRIIAR